MSFIRRIKKNGKIYLAEAESMRINGKVVQRHIRYIGKEIDGETVISISSKDLKVDAVKIYGPLLVLNRIANKIKLPKILGDYSNEILSMVYAHCLNYKSLNNMPDWFSRTDLNTLLDLDGLTESRLLSALDTLNDEAIDEYQRELFNNVKKTYNLSSQGIVYDVTNTYLYGKKCPMGKLGKSKDGKRDKPLIQIGLAVTQKEGIPVFHKSFDGNIADSRTLSALIKSFSDYRLSQGLFVYDRGIPSIKNINNLKKIKWDTLCGLPVKDKEKRIIRRILKTSSMTDLSNSVVINKTVFYVKSEDYIYGGVKGKLTIYYNQKKEIGIAESRRNEIRDAQILVSQKKSINEDFVKYLTPTGRVRQAQVDAAEEFDGYSVIFSTKKNISNEDMVRLSFDKDVVERAFKTLKGVTNLRPIRHWLYKRVISHIFICYLSYLLLSILKLNLKPLNISPEEALRNLESMYKVYLSDKSKKNCTLSRTVTLSKTQEKILRAVDKRLLKEV